MSCSPSTTPTKTTNPQPNSLGRHRWMPMTLRGWRTATPTSCCGWLPRHLFLECQDERVDIGLGGVERAHPAHVACCFVPEVEPHALLQPLADVVRQPGEDRVRLHRIQDS